MKSKRNLAALAALSLVVTWAAIAPAWGADHQHSAAATSSKPGAKDDLTSGEIRRVDKANKGLIIRHEDIKNLQMPGMTMPFRVKQPNMLEGLKDGDKIRFRAEQVGADLVVTEIHVIKP